MVAIWVYAVVLTTAFGHMSFALECYQCVFCDDPFKLHEANVVNCTGSCEQAKTNGKTVRLCSEEYIEDNCIFHMSRKTLGTRDACGCNEDLCNRGLTFVSPRYVVFGVVMALFTVS